MVTGPCGEPGGTRLGKYRQSVISQQDSGRRRVRAQAERGAGKQDAASRVAVTCYTQAGVVTKLGCHSGHC